MNDVIADEQLRANGIIVTGQRLSAEEPGSRAPDVADGCAAWYGFK